MMNVGGRQPEFGVPRRSVTAPIPVSSSSAASAPAVASDALVETLYTHHNARIVAFTARGTSEEASRGIPASSPIERTIAVGPFKIFRARGSVAFVSCGSALQPILPKSQCWCLDENKSRFVLQIRKPSYWRIELPATTAQEVSLAQDFQSTMDLILQFEKTQCPFQRSFTVEIPDGPEIQTRPWAPREADSAVDYTAAVNTQPVRPSAIWDVAKSHGNGRRRSPSALPDVEPNGSSTAGDDLMRGTHGGTESTQHKRNVATAVEEIDGLSAGQDAGFFQETPAMAPSRDGRNRQDRPTDPELSSPENEAELFLTTSHSSMGDDSPTHQVHEGAGSQGSLRKARLRRTTGFPMRRSATFPSVLQSSPPSALAIAEEAAPLSETTPPMINVIPELTEQAYQTEATDSSKSSQSTTAEPQSDPEEPSASGVELSSEQPASSPPCRLQPVDSDESAGPAPESSAKERSRASIREISSQIPGSWYDDDSQDSQSSSASLGKRNSRARSFRDDSAISSSLKVPDHPLRRRKSADSFSVAKRREPSSKAAAPTASITSTNKLALSRYINPLSTVGKLPLAIIAKTAEMVLGPPSHLIVLMLRVTAKIVSGQWKGEELGYDEHGEQIPVQWDYSEGDFSDWSDDEDDDVASVRERRTSFRTDMDEVTDDGKST